MQISVEPSQLLVTSSGGIEELQKHVQPVENCCILIHLLSKTRNLNSCHTAFLTEYFSHVR